MKRLFLILTALMLLLTSCTGSGLIGSKLPSQHIREIGNKTVALVLTRSRGDVKVYCSGVWISSNTILTAEHCIKGLVTHLNKEKDDKDMFDFNREKSMGLKIHYVLENEVSHVGAEPTAIHLGTVIALDPLHDLALVKADGVAIPSHQVVEVAEESPAIGEKVNVVGHPTGLYWTYTIGYVASYRAEIESFEKERLGPYMQVSTPLWFGNSGGGCFDSSGKLVGIASFMMSAPSTGFFIHIKSIRAFLVKNKL
jgi:V8-like Glu-specific endopeptidase